MTSYPWIAQQREAAFRKEVSDPNVWINLAAMMLSEGTPQESLESLFNRTMFVREYRPQTTLMDMITGPTQARSFYGPYRRGEYPNFIHQVRGSQAIVDKMDAAINAVMGGSDLVQGYTDQGLPTDPNGQRQPQIKIGDNVFCDWDGGANWGAPGFAGAAKWRENFEAHRNDPVAAPAPTPTPAPAPAPSAPDVIQVILDALKTAGKLPAPVINITTQGEVTIMVNGKQVS